MEVGCGRLFTVVVEVFGGGVRVYGDGFIILGGGGPLRKAIRECRVCGRGFVALMLKVKMRACGGDATSEWSMHTYQYHKHARHVQVKSQALP
jgi:hypothetical protein